VRKAQIQRGHIIREKTSFERACDTVCVVVINLCLFDCRLWKICLCLLIGCGRSNLDAGPVLLSMGADAINILPYSSCLGVGPYF
jgi:hypothetical protein